MKTSKLILQAVAVSMPLWISACATSPFTGKDESADAIQHEFDEYQARVSQVTAQLQTDAQDKTNVVNASLAELNARKGMLASLVNPPAANQASQVSTGSISPILASLFAIAGVALHLDNRRKDSVLNAAKVVRNTGGGTGVKTAPLPKGSTGPGPKPPNPPGTGTAGQTTTPTPSAGPSNAAAANSATAAAMAARVAVVGLAPATSTGQAYAAAARDAADAATAHADAAKAPATSPVAAEAHAAAAVASAASARAHAVLAKSTVSPALHVQAAIAHTRSATAATTAARAHLVAAGSPPGQPVDTSTADQDAAAATQEAAAATQNAQSTGIAVPSTSAATAAGAYAAVAAQTARQTMTENAHRTAAAAHVQSALNAVAAAQEHLRVATQINTAASQTAITNRDTATAVAGVKAVDPGATTTAVDDRAAQSAKVAQQSGQDQVDQTSNAIESAAAGVAKAQVDALSASSAPSAQTDAPKHDSTKRSQGRNPQERFNEIEAIAYRKSQIFPKNTEMQNWLDAEQEWTLTHSESGGKENA